MKKKYPVILTEAQREQLKSLIAAGTAPARKLTHARILLKADQSPEGPGWVDEQVADAVEVSQPTVSRVRKQYFEEGLQAALNRRPPNREYQRKLDGEQEARLVALACSEPPEKGKPAGVYDYWPRSWLSLRSWKRFPTRRSEGFSKKRTQAAPEKTMVHPATGECGVCVEDGGCAGGLHPPV
jgi:transposase